MLLVFLRGASALACLCGFGCLLFSVLILREPRLQPPLLRLARGSLLAGAMLIGAWLVQQTASMAETERFADLLSALPVVAFDTAFGQVALARLGLLLLSLLLCGPFRRIALLPAAGALVLQAGTAHAAARLASGGAVLLISETLHLLAAGAWLGGLAPLLICVAALSHQSAARLARAFSPLALAAVLLLAGTGLLQGSVLIGGFGNLVRTGYGRMALVKLVLFGVLLVIAGANRFLIIERRRWLLGSLVVETLLGVAVVMAAARLGSMAPVM